MTVICYYDGSCGYTHRTSRTGVMSWSWLIEDETGEVLTSGVTIGDGDDDRGTNVVAEYHALLAALEALAQLDLAGPARVLGDNQVVVDQVRGSSACYAGHLRPLRDRVRAVIADLEAAGVTVTLEVIGRKANKADALLRPPKRGRPRRMPAGLLN